MIILPIQIQITSHIFILPSFSAATVHYTLKPTNPIYQHFLQEHLHKYLSAKSKYDPKLILFPCLGVIHSFQIYLAQRILTKQKVILSLYNFGAATFASVR